MLIAKILFLLLLANGAPIVAKRLLGARLLCPVDGGRRFVDGRALFGESKTWRGLVAAVLATSIGAVSIGFTMQTGLLFAFASLTGDLVSSFIKRRLNLPPSSSAIGLDQLPESILPMLVCWQALELDLQSAAAVIVLFFCGELLLSRVLFRLHVRDRPY